MSAYMNPIRRVLPGLLGGLMLLAGVAHAGTVTYVYTDPQGTPLAEADASGNITATYDYAPYGSQALGTPPDGPGYTGHVNDPDTGLVYMQARYYDPVVGRFISTDPVGPSAGNAFNFSRYAYANNNPIVNMDPDGRLTGSLLHTDEEGEAGEGYTTIVNPKEASGGGSQAQQKKSAVIYGETSGLRSKVGKNGKPAAIRGADPSLKKARENISDISSRNTKVYSHIPTAAELRDPNVRAAWQASQAAAADSTGRLPGRFFFLIQKGVGAQRPPITAGYGQGKPIETYGPFINAGGGDVPAGNQTYINIYNH